MKPALSIWSPVITAQLYNPHRCQEEVIYPTEQRYQSLEELKIKLKDSQARIQGKVVEVVIKLDILFVVRDETGRLQLLTRGETVRERILLRDFNHVIDKEQPPEFIVNITNLSWEGELKRSELKATYYIDYMILALNEQVVTLAIENEEEETGEESVTEIVQQLENELARLVDEKEELRRKLYFYERDISSLKKGIYKVENRNAILNSEVNHYQELVEQLQAAISAKERQLQRLEPSPAYSTPNWQSDNDKPWGEEARINWGSRLKRMFMNSL